MKDIKFIDCNCMIGKRSAPAFCEPETTGDVKRILLETGISRALAYHSRSVEYHPLEGNARLIEEVGKDAFFIPVWVVMPGQTGEFPRSEALAGQLVLNDVKALRAAPGDLNYSLSDWSAGEIYYAAQSMKLPLMINAYDIGWDRLFEILALYPGLKVILMGAGYRQARYFYPIMERFENLYIEISMYKNHMGLEHLVKSFGSERIIYGSGLPRYSPGCAKAMVLRADIEKKDKENIAGGNILRLIGECYE